MVARHNKVLLARVSERGFFVATLSRIHEFPCDRALEQHCATYAHRCLLLPQCRPSLTENRRIGSTKTNIVQCTKVYMQVHSYGGRMTAQSLNRLAISELTK